MTPMRDSDGDNDMGAAKLANPDQIAAEKLALEILALPETKAIWSDIRLELGDDPAMLKPAGAATIERSLTLWTNFLSIREYAGDPDRPKILWVVENAAHQWSGFTFPGTGAAGDNPDNIYRATFIDGASRYEIHGRRPPNGSTQFSVEVTRGGPGHFVLVPQSAKTPDLGDQVGMLNDRSIKIDADGRFIITLDAEPANGRPNHITIERGPQSVNFRDSSSDWTLIPTPLNIRRVAGPAPAAPLTKAEIISRTLKHMPSFVLFWACFKNGWLGAPAPNTLATPAPRDGGWGFLAGGHYDLADDEAMVVKTIQAGARYTGAQVTNPWMIASDGSQANTSRNLSQITPGSNGEVTYVISSRDAGAPNWIDTTGLRQGMMLFRWQQTDPTTVPASLLRDFLIVKLADLRSVLPPETEWVAPPERAEELRRRRAAHERRLQD